MSILDKLLTKPETAYEMEAAKPLIGAQAEEAKARANSTTVTTVTENYIKLMEQLGDKDLEDFLAGLELFAETSAKVARAVKS